MFKKTKRLSKEETMELIKTLNTETKKAEHINVPPEKLLPLIDLADSLHINFPKTNAIIYAYKLGYLNNVVQQNCSEKKKKLLELVSAIDKDNIIDYFYNFITLRLCTAGEIPPHFYSEVHTQYQLQQSKIIKQEHQLTTSQKVINENICEILRMLNDINSEKEIRYLRIIVSDVHKDCCNNQ